MTFKMTSRRRLAISLLPLLLLIFDVAHSSSPQLNTINNNAAGLEGFQEDSILIKSRYLEKDTKGNETDNNSNPNDGQDQATEKPEENEKKGSEACSAAKSCEDCVEAAKTFESDSENTCAWQIGDGVIECLTVSKEDVKDQEGDLCSNENKNTPTDKPTTKDTASNNTDETEKNNQVQPTHNDYGEEGNGGAIFALLLMFLFAGGIYYNKDKILQATAGLETLMQEQSGGTSSSSKGKYQK